MYDKVQKINPRVQAQVASLVAGGGLIWAAKVGTSSRMGILALVNTPGLVETFCVTILVWLIAKWRSVAPRRTHSTAQA
jgi:hypothetical protein